MSFIGRNLRQFMKIIYNEIIYYILNKSIQNKFSDRMIVNNIKIDSLDRKTESKSLIIKNFTGDKCNKRLKLAYQGRKREKQKFIKELDQSIFDDKQNFYCSNKSQHQPPHTTTHKYILNIINLRNLQSPSLATPTTPVSKTFVHQTKNMQIQHESVTVLSNIKRLTSVDQKSRSNGKRINSFSIRNETSNTHTESRAQSSYLKHRKISSSPSSLSSPTNKNIKNPYTKEQYLYRTIKNRRNYTPIAKSNPSASNIMQTCQIRACQLSSRTEIKDQYQIRREKQDNEYLKLLAGMRNKTDQKIDIRLNLSQHKRRISNLEHKRKNNTQIKQRQQQKIEVLPWQIDNTINLMDFP